ncbi:hypothetical protein [Clostridium cellulovorans]|uniref:Lipoprotein n=2 Tax=Clostridium cellulovorans TaxID=1493 RepID=D9SX52_CLOC7|nr:hypothetical protein [Clostridium cellulovorans]ADL53355.1 hypothetical protein Clocel_3685 [Clostridium cellulovorans 743B]BAE92569.1 hypothetical protein [Clostridium cellulovorans 743B]
MKKKFIYTLLFIAAITITGCGDKQVKENVSTSTSTDAILTEADKEKTEENNQIETSNEAKDRNVTRDNNEKENSNNETDSEKISYDSYSGSWVIESNLRADYHFGLGVRLTIDKEGNLDGNIGNTSTGITHVATFPIKGKIENDKFSYTFEQDGWGNKGTINMEFNKKQIVLTIKYDESNERKNFWGIGEGTFTLVNRETKVERSLEDLKKGGLAVIQDQCFNINLDSYGEVKFISGTKRADGYTALRFYLAGKNDKIIYYFPEFSTKNFLKEMKAVSFQDINNDGLKEIIVIAEYNSSGPKKEHCSIYFPKSGEFINDKNIDDKINSYQDVNTINSVIQCYKTNFK